MFVVNASVSRIPLCLAAYTSKTKWYYPPGPSAFVMYNVRVWVVLVMNAGVSSSNAHVMSGGYIDVGVDRGGIVMLGRLVLVC
jgi:hypothetical protein